MIVKTLLKAVRYMIRDKYINQENRRKLKNHNFTIISSDCTGGTIYHDLNEKFNSPTINLYIEASDYIKFISNMEYYLKLPMEEIEKENCSYPCARLGDITLHLVHYKSIEDAREKWETRKKRINANNIFYIMNDRNGCTKKEMEDFVSLPFKNKLFFTSNKEWKTTVPELCFLPAFEGKKMVGIMTAYCFPWSIKRNYDYFDYVTWLNEVSE